MSNEQYILSFWYYKPDNNYKFLPRRSNTRVRSVTEGIGIMDVVDCWDDMADIPSSDDRLSWCWGVVKFCTNEVGGMPELLMTVVIAVDNGILPRMWWSCCSEDINGEGMVKDAFGEENFPPSAKNNFLLRH